MIRSLKARWIISYIIVILTTALILDVVVTRSLSKYFLHQIERRLQDNLILVQDIIQNSPWDKTLDERAKSIGFKLNSRMTFINLDGVVLGDTDVANDQISGMENHKDRPEVMSAFTTGFGQTIRYSHTLHTDMMYVAIPCKKDNKIIGILRMALPLTRYNEALQETRRWIYTGSFIAIVCSILIGYYLAYSITNPIRKMVFAAQQIADEKFSQRIHVQTHDELRVLADSLNTMSSKLDSRFRQIKEEKHQLETILSGMSEGVLVLDKAGKAIVVNSAFTRMMNIRENPIGRTILEITRNPDVAKAMEDGLGKGDIFQKEIIFPAPNPKTIRIYAAPLRQDNEITGLVAVFHDITDLRTLEQIRKDFVANVSHELRTPLTTIQGFSETLLSGALENKEYAQKFVANIHTQTQRMSELVEDLLCLSSIESGKAGMKSESVHFKEIMESAIGIVTPLAENKKVLIQKDYPKEDIFISGDKSYLERAFINLLDNAIKFSNSNTRIQIGIKNQAEDIVVTIEDEGVGISSNDVSRIFERFYRVDKSRSKETAGTGLGLSIVKHIVDAHKGTIQVESTLGQGTKFIVQLPKNPVH